MSLRSSGPFSFPSPGLLLLFIIYYISYFGGCVRGGEGMVRVLFRCSFFTSKIIADALGPVGGYPSISDSSRGEKEEGNATQRFSSNRWFKNEHPPPLTLLLLLSHLIGIIRHPIDKAAPLTLTTTGEGDGGAGGHASRYGGKHRGGGRDSLFFWGGMLAEDRTGGRGQTLNVAPEKAPPCPKN